MSLQSYLRSFAGSDHGRIVCSNALDGDGIGLHRLGFSAEVVIAAYANATRDRDATTPREFIRLIADLAVSAGGAFCGQAAFGKGYKLNKIQPCTILPLGVLPTFATGADIERFARQTGERFCDFGNPDWVEKLARLEPSEQYFRLKPGRVLGTSFIWITSKATLDLALRAALGRGVASDKLGEYSRDLLGLVHRVASPPPEPPLFLAAFAFPAGVAAKAGHFRPTFVEAGGHRRFSTRARRKRTPRNHAWGKTIDLAPLDTSGSLESGVNERVCRPIDRSMFSDAEAVSFRVLGRITKANTTTDEVFSRALAAGRTDSYLSLGLGGAP